MTPTMILAELDKLGVIIQVEGDDLRIRPRHKLTDSLRHEIVKAKPDLIREIRLWEGLVAPAILEHPGLWLDERGLWRRGSFIIPTIATMPALCKRQRENQGRVAGHNPVSQEEALIDMK